MSGLIPQRFVEDLLDRVDLAELIGSRITLKKAGANYKACCPFHDEKTPSFNVRPDKGFYHLPKLSKSWRAGPGWKCHTTKLPSRKSSRRER